MQSTRNPVRSCSLSLPKPTVLAELIVLLFGGLASLGASAQAVPTPGAIFDSVRPAEPVIPAPQRQSPIVLPATPGLGSLDPDAPRTQVSALRIVGNQAIDTATLQHLVANQAGKPMNLYELNEVTRRITDYYRKQGFPVARAVIPAQKVEGGVVTIEVVEGRIDKTAFRGNKLYSNQLLQRWGQPLVGQVATTKALEERVLALNDLPGLEAQAVLRPGDEYGTTTMEVVTKEKPVDGEISFNNYGRKEVGEDRVDASVNLNNPFGIGDQLGFRGSYSQGGLIRLGGLNYSLPLNVQGTRLAFSYTEIDYRIGGDLEAADINGKSTLGSATVIHPFLRSQNENLFGTLGVRTFSGTQYASDVSLTDNRVSVLEAGLAWNHIDPCFDIATASVRMSSNFKGYDDEQSDIGQKLKIDGDASYLYNFDSAWSVKVSGAAQWSADTLADAEQFSLGGPNSLRGYPSADVRGDRGASISVEGRYRTVVLGAPGYFSVFADGGYVARVHPDAGLAKSNSVGSAGIGATFFPTRTLQLEVAAAAPTGKLDASDDKSARLWVNLTKRF